jgi:hypothetical protein
MKPVHIGQYINISTIDTRGIDLKVTDVKDFRVNGGGLQDLYIRTPSELEATRKVRIIGGLEACEAFFLLNQFDSTPFDEGLERSVRLGGMSTFDLNDEKAFFPRFGGPNSEPMLMTTAGASFEVWDFCRKTTDEAGHAFDEFLFVEKSNTDGWFTIWRGREYPIALLEAF